MYDLLFSKPHLKAASLLCKVPSIEFTVCTVSKSPRFNVFTFAGVGLCPGEDGAGAGGAWRRREVRGLAPAQGAVGFGCAAAEGMLKQGGGTAAVGGAAKQG